jgi:HK97 gp10 family phage protein
VAGIFDMSLVGLDALNEFMNACAKNESKLIRKATAEGAKVILKEARARCPEGDYEKKKTYLGTYRKSKNLKKSLKVRILRQKDPGRQLVLIGTTVGKKARYDGWYGRLVEDGHKIAKATGTYQSNWRKLNRTLTRYEYGGSDVKPRPFLRPAADEKQGEAFQKAAQVYGENWGETVLKDIEDLGDILAD